MYILHIPSWFPDVEKPYTGNFIEKHIGAISKMEPGITMKVVKSGTITQRMTDLLVSEGNRVVTYFVKQRSGWIGKVWMAIFIKLYYFIGSQYIKNEYGLPKLIHLHVSIPKGSFAVRLKRKWKVPLVLTEHWSIYHKENRDSLSNSLLNKLNKIFQQVDALSTVSEHLLRSIQEMFPIKKSGVISNVVDCELFVPQSVINQKKQIIHISTLDESAKNFIGILRCIKEISKKRKDFELQVISEFQKPDIEQYVIENELSDVVHFLGNKSEQQVAVQLSQADFLILFSNYENQPCVILEAFSCGKPVIATSVGGIPEIVTQDRGLLVPKQDEKALQSAILEMLETHSNYSESSTRAYALEHFSQEKIGQSFAEFYKSMV